MAAGGRAAAAARSGGGEAPSGSGWAGGEHERTTAAPWAASVADRVLGIPCVFAELVKETSGWWINTNLWAAS